MEDKYGGEADFIGVRVFDAINVSFEDGYRPEYTMTDAVEQMALLYEICLELRNISATLNDIRAGLETRVQVSPAPPIREKGQLDGSTSRG